MDGELDVAVERGITTGGRRARHYSAVLSGAAGHAASIIEPIAYSIPLSIWVGYLSESLESDVGYVRAIRNLGIKNLLLVGTLAVIVGIDLLRTRREGRRQQAAEAGERTTEWASRRVLLATLDNANSAVSRALQVTCNARYFPVVEGLDGLQLVQARDLFIERIPMPKEYGFTAVPLDDPAIVSARSFKTRSPIYEVLPEDHITQYTPEFADMVEERQRWVLACPVLSIDSISGDLRADRRPHGVLVFYGVEIPNGVDVDRCVLDAKSYSQKAAEAFSFVLEIRHTVSDLVHAR